MRPMIEVELAAVRMEAPSNTPVVVLRERINLQRQLSIFIGAPEATAIAFVLEGVETPRPLTHDLIKDMLDSFGAELQRVVVTELRESTFYAELHLRAFGGVHVVSSRPSDAIAIAARVGCPIFVEESVMEEAGVIDDLADVVIESDDPDEVVEEFRQFIDQVNPDDFAS
jgi:bifunctional DNase/RNase